MSWAKDEWKQNLPPNALQKIVALEDEVEYLRKAKQQQICQYEGLQAAFQKQKQMTGDEKAANSGLEQAVQELSQKCSEFDRQVEHLQSELKIKVQKVDLLEDQVQRAKQKSTEDNEEIMNLQREMSLKQNELRQYAEKNSELCIEYERMKQANTHLAKDVEAFTAKVKDLTNENESYRDQLFQRVGGKTNFPLQAKKEPKHAETEKALEQDVENTGGVFLEMMKKEKNALISKNSELKKDKEHMKRTVEEKERELQRVEEKLAATTAELEVKLKALTAKEKEVKKLRQEPHDLEVKNQMLHEELEFLKRTYAVAEKTITSMSEDLRDTQFTIQSMDAELGKKATSLEARRERIEKLQIEKQELADQLDRLKAGDSTVLQTAACHSVTEGLKSTIKELEAELKNDANLIRGKDERIKALEQENSELEREIDELEAELENGKHFIKETEERFKVLEQEKSELGREVDNLKAELENRAILVAERGEKIKALEQENSELGRGQDNLKAELESGAILIAERVEKIKVLKEEKSELGRELDNLKQQRRSEEDRKLEADADENVRQLKEQLRRVEHLLAENSQLNEELEVLRCDFKEMNTSYNAVARALDESRALVESMRHQLTKTDQPSEKLEQEMDGGMVARDELNDRELKVANRLKAQPQSIGTTQQRIMGEVISQMREPESSEASPKDQLSLQPHIMTAQGMPERLSALLVQLQEEHEMVEVKVRQCLNSLHETCGIVGSPSNEQDENRSPNEILVRLGELRVFLDSLLESAFHCRLMIRREDHEVTQVRIQDADTAFVLGESSREGFAQQTRGHGNEDLSWDDYDREKAFQTFRDDVECVVQQLETEKKAAKKKAKESREVKRAHTALREIRRKSRQSHAGPSSCENPAGRDEELEVLVWDRRERLQLLSEGPVVAEHPYEECRMEAEQSVARAATLRAPTESAVEHSGKAQDINPSQLLETHSREPKVGQSRQRKVLDVYPSQPEDMDLRDAKGRQTSWRKTAEINPSELAQIMKVVLQESNQESERSLAEHFKRLQEILQCRQIRTEDEEEKRAGAEHAKSALDGRYAVSELELSKKKLTGVQRSIKELISALAAAQHESEARRGHVERLTRELQKRESRHKEECAELKNVVRCASQQEMALKRRVESLDAQQEELNNELRQVIEKLKQKELELVGNSQKLRDLQTKSTEGEATLRNNIKALQAENEALWEDYKEASKQAERREADVRGIKEHLKGSEAQLIAIFHRLCNVDEDVRRAREKQLYDD